MVFKKVLNLFNFPKHIKKFFLRRRIKRYKKRNEERIDLNKGSLLLKIINFFIYIVAILAIAYIAYIYRQNDYFIYWGMGGLLFITIFLSSKIINSKRLDSKEVSRLILKDEDGRRIDKWNVDGITAFLIGKKTERNQVDIDLSGSTYSSLISREHAVMNNVSGVWYLEDLGSANGSGIKRGKTEEKFRLDIGKPYRINFGDTVYIANTKILVK